MFKRLRWTLFGALIGAGGSVWARRRVRRAVRRYLPERLRTDARRWVSMARDDLRAAIDEGRSAMEEREAELGTLFADRLMAQPPRRGKVIEADPPSSTRLPALPPASPPPANPSASLLPDSPQAAAPLTDPPADSPPAGPRPAPARRRLAWGRRAAPVRRSG